MCGSRSSLVAILAATLLSLRDRSARTTLAEQARLLELSHDTVIIRDKRDHIIFWNDGAEQLYGWSRAEALGMRCDELLGCELPDAEIEASLARDGHWTGELTRMRRRRRAHRPRQPLAVAPRSRGRRHRRDREQRRRHRAQACRCRAAALGAALCDDLRGRRLRHLGGRSLRLDPQAALRHTRTGRARGMARRSPGPAARGGDRGGRQRRQRGGRRPLRGERPRATARHQHRQPVRARLRAGLCPDHRRTARRGGRGGARSALPDAPAAA